MFGMKAAASMQCWKMKGSFECFDKAATTLLSACTTDFYPTNYFSAGERNIGTFATPDACTQAVLE